MRCLFALIACVMSAAEPEWRAVEGSALVSMDRLMEQVGSKRVVLVGETHDRPDHHDLQLDIIRRMHKASPALAIGVEQVQQAFQKPLDDYIQGRIDEAAFLRQTEYYERWRYDYRLYAPIFRFAREHQIPVVALNVPTALSRAVAKGGIAGLSDEMKKAVPRQIEPPDEDYRARLKKAFDAHAPGQTSGFEKFLEAQLVWDEGMAEQAANYLTAHPGVRMVVLAGSGHVAFPNAIPKRIERRTQASWASVVAWDAEDPAGGEEASYVVFTKPSELPPAGKLGIEFEAEPASGGARVKTVVAQGGAAQAKLRAGDVVTAIDGAPVTRPSDASVLLWDKTPGDTVQLTVRRNGAFGTMRTRTVDVVLSSL